MAANEILNDGIDDDMSQDDMRGVGRLKNKKRKNDKQEARREFTAYDREMLSKDIAFLVNELHDEAMNFKGVSIDQFLVNQMYCYRT